MSSFSTATAKTPLCTATELGFAVKVIELSLTGLVASVKSKTDTSFSSELAINNFLVIGSKAEISA
ncbi:hypothetical protein Q4595_07795 [Wenyingzhuangia sp. 1_MG-2023]|nr:hypothetical protein [Wenyingzhuangia sp. 1_MG-2023]